MTCSSSASSACLLECRALRTRKLFGLTLDHFLTFVANSKWPISDEAQVGCGSGVPHYRGNTLTAATVHRYPRYSGHGGGKLPRFHRCFADARAFSDSFPLECCWQSQQHWPWRVGGAGARAFLLIMLFHCARPDAHTSAATADFSSITFMVPPHCASRRWTVHEHQFTDVSIFLDWKWCHRMEKVVAILQAGDKETLVLPSCHHQFRTESLNLQNVTLHRARHSGPSIDRAMNVNPPNECKSRVQCHGSERTTLREKTFVWQPTLWRLVETFAPLAEGTRRGKACTSA